MDSAREQAQLGGGAAIQRAGARSTNHGSAGSQIAAPPTSTRTNRNPTGEPDCLLVELMNTER